MPKPAKKKTATPPEPAIVQAKKKRQRNPLADAIASCLSSGDDEFRALAIKRLQAVLDKHNGVVLHSAAFLGVSERAFRHWLEDDKVRADLGVPRKLYKAP